MNLTSKKYLASKILKVGVSRVILNPNYSEELSEAITRASLRSLIKDKAIEVAPKRGVSKGRLRIKSVKKRKRGVGSREGTKGSRNNKKTQWMRKVRSQRTRIKLLRDRGVITNETFGSLYTQIKGGNVRSLRHLSTIVKEVSK